MELGFFTPQIIQLLDELSSDISFSLVTLDHEEQRISAEQDLKKSELQYRRLFETAQDAILILDGDTGEIIEANSFILEMLGYPLDYCIGKHLWELGFIKDKSIAQHAFTDLKTNGSIRYKNLSLETKDGRNIHVDLISHAYFVGDKKIFQCNIRDITARKRMEDALRESEERYRAFFTTSQDCVFITATDGRWVDFNDAAVKLFGYESREDLLRADSPLLYANPRDRDTHLRYIREKEYSFEYPVDLTKKDGTIINTLISTVIRKDSSGNIIGFQGTIRDITEKTATLDRIEELL
jgi:PAS domain S-box-containing protein